MVMIVVFWFIILRMERIERTSLRVGQIINYLSGGEWRLHVVTGYCSGHTILNSHKPKEEWELELISGGSISNLPIETTEYKDLSFNDVIKMFNRIGGLSEAEITHLKSNFGQ